MIFVRASGAAQASAPCARVTFFKGACCYCSKKNMSATLKTWLQGRSSLEAAPSTPSKDRPVDLGRPSLGRAPSFNDFSCSAAEDGALSLAYPRFALCCPSASACEFSQLHSVPAITRVLAGLVDSTQRQLSPALQQKVSQPLNSQHACAAENDLGAPQGDRKRRLANSCHAPASSSAPPLESASAGAAADWLQFRRPPLSRGMLGVAPGVVSHTLCTSLIQVRPPGSFQRGVSHPISIQPRDSTSSMASGSDQSEDCAPETPTARSAFQRKSESIEHWEWSELIRGSSL